MNKIFNYEATSQTMLADRYTPVNAYMKVRDLYTQSCLMESSDYQSEQHSRSFICFHPLASIAVGHDKATLQWPDGTQQTYELGEGFRVEDAFERFMSQLHVENDE